MSSTVEISEKMVCSIDDNSSALSYLDAFRYFSLSALGYAWTADTITNKKVIHKNMSVNLVCWIIAFLFRGKITRVSSRVKSMIL